MGDRLLSGVYRKKAHTGMLYYAAGSAVTVLLAIAVTCRAGAVTLDWDDLTNAQQEQAYNDLAQENEELKEKLAALEGESGTGADYGSSGSVSDSTADGISSGSAADSAGSSSGISADIGGNSDNGSANSSGGGSDSLASGENQDVSAGDSQTSSSGNSEASQSGDVKDTNTFLTDLAASFNARQELARTYTADQVSAMSESEMWDYRFTCAEQERSFYNEYSGAQFDDLNVLYLCSEYCVGLGKQYQAEDIWNSSQDSTEANRLYTAGYYNRAYALVELSEYYGLDLASEYQNLKNAVTQMDTLSGEETRNSDVDSATVTQVQELLNSIGFLCGTPDGIAGRQTASCIERFQVMYGYEPADGIIDDELIQQLNDVLARRKGS